MSDLDDFKAKNKPNGRVSKIEPYKNDILDLKSSGYSTADVVKYLAEYKNITVSVQAVNNFLKKQTGNLNKKTKANKKTAPRTVVRQPEKAEQNAAKTTFVMDRTLLSELLK